MNWGRCLVGVLLASVISAASASAQESEPGSAEPPAAEVEDAEEVAPPETPVQGEARSRFQLGESLYEQGRFDEALAEFERAHEISGRPELLYNIHLAHRDAGRPEEAAAALRGYLAEVEDIPNRGLLVGRLQSLESQAASIHDQEVATQEARARADRISAQHARPPSRVGPIVMFVLGGAALVAGGAMAFNVAAIDDELANGCFNGLCPYWFDDERDQLRRRAISVDALIAGGVALVAAGALWWAVTTPRGRDQIALGCGTTGCSVRGRF